MKTYDKIYILKTSEHVKDDWFSTQNIVETLGNQIEDVYVSHFSNRETNVEIHATGLNKVLLTSRLDLYENPNEFIMNIIFAADCLKRQGVSVDLFIPCLPYARQDRKNGRNVALTSSVVLKMFENYFDKIYVMDLHAPQLEGYISKPLINLNPDNIFLEVIRKEIKKHNYKTFSEDWKWVVVSPDAGGVKRAKRFADALGLPIAIIHKTRDPITNKSISHTLIGDVTGKNCIIVDDMIDSGGTLVDANNMLKEQGAKEVLLTISHGVLSKPNDHLSELKGYVLNTVIDSFDRLLTVETPKEIKIIRIEEYFLTNVLGVKMFDSDFGV